MAEITLDKVVKRYGKLEVVHGIDLKIAHNEFVVLVGPSGCGKSTTLRMIAGLEDISDGAIRIGGDVVNDLPPRKRNISMVFQNYALYPHMSVRENLGFGLKIAKQDPKMIEERVAEAAETLGLDALLDRTPAELSGGQRQRVAMGRAIVRHPEAFLFDEPLSNLDAKLRVQMRTEIKKLHQKVKTTVVYVTHDQVEAMTLADRIVIMRDGNIEQVGTPMEVFDHPLNTFVASFIGSPPMNLLPATVRGGAVHFTDGKSLPVPSRLAGKVRDGQEVTFGLRPDDLTPQGHGIAEGGERAQMELEVILSEPLGTETILYTTIAGQEAQGKMYGPRPVSPGERLVFDVALEKAHLFDAATGRSVAAD
ncbi:sn-glycerol-3-phosphate ABC transporter ATP-binding protein UgpC [Alphaproteobacteria bacterium GH1-50]|uniref:sn-glycerol-3-phosphate ABC transporter ATP-binding protein UgpC n=1 Tax=Kangsaoukella pontilimi TaxID=2691042 RepID=A0A7C9MCY7_9RHOB|nr:sn-glycerol-3-phosphate ABC transporter ATP-binding protein UgpC [Kangsaoukella pontilimi]MXQ07432.1 sn-glycerol-3-phosphate ABC transporter ATP-binding protein UgpC [Kangsaoukella pontilimi]